MGRCGKKFIHSQPLLEIYTSIKKCVWHFIQIELWRIKSFEFYVVVRKNWPKKKWCGYKRAVLYRRKIVLQGNIMEQSVLKMLVFFHPVCRGWVNSEGVWNYFMKIWGGEKLFCNCVSEKVSKSLLFSILWGGADLFEFT